MKNRVTEKQKVGFWARLKRLMVTDVGALARGLNAGDVEALERVMLESDFGLPATADLVDWIEGEIRRGTLKTDVDLRQGDERPADAAAVRARRSGRAGQRAQAADRDPGRRA